MQLPIIQGVIARRLLVNYRVVPDVIARLLPAPFRPKLVDGMAIAGICLIRLEGVRPRHFPAMVAISSENAAHRIAVEWGEGTTAREGVFIPRRDSNSRANALLGGRLFPGEQHHARFTANDEAERLTLDIASDDGAVRVSLAGHPAETLPATSIFPSVAAASRFFELGALGYSATRAPGRFDGMALRSEGWQVAPFAIERVASSFFDDPLRFPPGMATLDCALIMRGIRHEWHGRGQLCAPESVGDEATLAAAR
ncbi:MAG TPA: DUF2071 domain-containing protein [Thermomicrobiales bacterium]|jgi:hypothetical protein